MARMSKKFNPIDDSSPASVVPCDFKMKRAMKLAHEIGKKNTTVTKNKAILKWCEEVKRMLVKP